jgi:hypothetical protein
LVAGVVGAKNRLQAMAYNFGTRHPSGRFSEFSPIDEGTYHVDISISAEHKEDSRLSL